MLSALLETCTSGLINGAVYAMIATGLALVYGITKTFNFAYGSFFVMAGYLAWALFSINLPYILVFFIVITVMFGIGVAVDRYILCRLRNRKEWEISIVLTTLGLALAIDNFHVAVFGPYAKSLPPLFEGGITILNVSMGKHDAAAVVISIGVMIAFVAFIQKTRIGMAMRAVAQDMVGADIVAIPKEKIFQLSFGLSCVLVAISGMLFAPMYFVIYMGGWPIMVKGWVMTVFGGMGSIKGAILAGFILGMVEALVGWQLGFTWTMFFWVAIIIVVFIFRPKGLLGTGE
jgi:branched-chain amino acid transport system permease protein